ncbi:MAG: ankyrin repeat domain-containing protein [Bryobacteraceae bacterium]
MAANRGDIALMKLLLELGADPLLASAEETTPLLAAAGVGTNEPQEEAGEESEAVEAVKMLLDRGANINTVDKNGDTAMHGAAYNISPLVVKLLGERGADPLIWSKPNKAGGTPLFIAEGYISRLPRPDPATIEAITKLMRMAEFRRRGCGRRLWIGRRRRVRSEGDGYLIRCAGRAVPFADIREPRRQSSGIDSERDLLIEELAEVRHRALRVDRDLDLTAPLLEELIALQRDRQSFSPGQAVSPSVSGKGFRIDRDCHSRHRRSPRLRVIEGDFGIQQMHADVDDVRTRGGVRQHDYSAPRSPVHSKERAISSGGSAHENELVSRFQLQHLPSERCQPVGLAGWASSSNRSGHRLG